MKRIPLLLIVIVFLLTAASPLSAATPTIPQPGSNFYVLDQANVLDQATEQRIIQTSTELQKKTKAQIVVVTVDSLNNTSPEEFALAILRGWGIGDQQLNNGLLMLVSPQERVSRIEVGYGLEGALPDAKTGQIQDEYMIPFFQKNDYNSGILNGYNALAQVVAKEYQVTIEGNPPTTSAGSSSTAAKGKTLPLWSKVVIFLLILVFFILDQRLFNGFFFGLILGMLFRGRGGGGGFGGGSGGGGFGGGGSGGGGGSSRRW